MTAKLSKQDIRGVIAEQFLAGQENLLCADNESLFENGIADSLGAFKIACELENKFATKLFDEDDINFENFQSVDLIFALLQRYASDNEPS